MTGRRRKWPAQFDGRTGVESAVRATLGRAYLALWKMDKAREHLREALQLRRRSSGGDHPEIIRIASDLNQTLLNTGDLDEARLLNDWLVPAALLALGEADPLTRRALKLQSFYHYKLNEMAEAERLDRSLLESGRRLFGDEDSRTLEAMQGLVVTLQVRGNVEEAEALCRELLATARHREPEDAKLLFASTTLGSVLVQRGDPAGAEPLLAEGLDAAQRVYGPEHFLTATRAGELAVARLDLGKAVEAERYSVRRSPGSASCRRPGP